MALKLPRGEPRIGDTGRAAETRLAKSIGAQLRPASGAMEGVKGDMTLSGVLFEAKSTTGRSISVKHEWLGKIAKEARDQNMKPALTLSFTNGNGRPVPSGEWVCVPLKDYLDLLTPTGEEV